MPAVERLIRENGHIFTEAQCKVCSALLISESQRLAHYQVSRAVAGRVPLCWAVLGHTLP